MTRLFRSVPARIALVTFTLFFSLSTLTRFALLVAARHEVIWNFSLLGALVAGIFCDAAAGIFAAAPGALAGALIPLRWLRSKPGRLLLATKLWGFSCILVFIATAEWFFWDEFNVRFNFIAVDYLIWTQEVWGNIHESYPMPAILTGIALLAAGMVWGLRRAGALGWITAGTTAWPDRCGWIAAAIALPALTVLGVSEAMLPAFANSYHRELAKNGYWSFFAAFKQMELNYEQWYLKLPPDEALAAAKKLLVTPDEPATTAATDDLHRSPTAHAAERRSNVMLICMESLSSDYMTYLGNTGGLTPNLDRLANESLFFENLYATGTRTVRGMEALTLNLPPTPGQAIIYRPDGVDLTTTFTPFLDRGYDCAFFYGGDGRFDYMNRYFSTAGCRIMDVNAWDTTDVTFKTSWGACDEDLFHKAIKVADVDYAAGKPFNFFCMTTSNHRPYAFPAGRIETTLRGRNAAVKYSDWAIGDLMAKAATRPWFKDTLFVIVSDHCASSAGRTELDVTKYRIPGMIYQPGLVSAKRETLLCSQIDIMPTVFGVLDWSYQTLSYGHDLLAPAAGQLPGRAFVSNYQRIALLRDDAIAILKPNRKSAAYACDRSTGAFSPLEPAAAAALVHDATAFYQSAAWLFKHGKLKRAAAPAAKE